LTVIGRGAQRLSYTRHQDVDVLLQHRQVQIEFAREVLVENRFADSGPIGDLVHPGGVKAPVDEHLAGRHQ
jgi:hypothetical protein